MKIINVEWTPKINIITVTCDICNAVFPFRVDRWIIRCPICNTQEKIEKLRKEWVKNYG